MVAFWGIHSRRAVSILKVHHFVYVGSGRELLVWKATSDAYPPLSAHFVSLMVSPVICQLQHAILGVAGVLLICRPLSRATRKARPRLSRRLMRSQV